MPIVKSQRELSSETLFEIRKGEGGGERGKRKDRISPQS